MQKDESCHMHPEAGMTDEPWLGVWAFPYLYQTPVMWLWLPLSHDHHQGSPASTLRKDKMSLAEPLVSLKLTLSYFILLKSIFHEFFQATPWFDEQIQENLSLALSVKYFVISPIFMTLFPKVSDTTKVVFRMKWV